MDGIRGRALIIWGAWSELKKKLFGASLKKNGSQGCQKNKIDQRKSEKKNLIRGSPKKNNSVQENPDHAPPFD